jgi:hypothetical protein
VLDKKVPHRAWRPVRNDISWLKAVSQRLKLESLGGTFSARLEAVPFPVVVDRPVLGGHSAERLLG